MPIGRTVLYLTIGLLSAFPVHGQTFGGSYTSSWFAEDDLGRLDGFSMEASYKGVLVIYSKVQGSASERGRTCVGLVSPDDFCPEEPIQVAREAKGLRFGYRVSVVQEKMLWIDLIPTLGVTDAGSVRRGEITGRVQEDPVEYIDFGIGTRLGVQHGNDWLPQPMVELMGFILAGDEAEQCVDCFIGSLAGNSYRFDARLGLEWRL